MNITSQDIVSWGSFVASFYFALCLIGDIHAWRVTISVYGKMPWLVTKQMFFSILKSRIHYYLWGPLLIFLIIIKCRIIWGTVYPTSFLVAATFFWAHLLIYQCLPPSILLLGTSRHECVTLRHKLERGLHPYRVVVLLEPFSANSSIHSLFVRNLFEWDNLRTSTKKWKSVVHPLMDIVPAIVLDARVPTPGVLEETRRILAEGFISKTVFLVEDNTNAPVLDALDIKISDYKFLIAQELRLVELLKKMGLSRTSSPDDHPFFKRY